MLWPALLTAILLMLVHALIVTNAQAEAELAASQGLRAAWRVAAESAFLDDPDVSGFDSSYAEPAPHPEVHVMADAAKDAVARSAGTESGWRWWTSGVAQVHSDWCFDVLNTSLPPGERRPIVGETGWVRVVVSGDVFGPLAALWPNRWDQVYAVAEGPAILVQPTPVVGEPRRAVPARLPAC